MSTEENGITATSRSTKDLGWTNSDIPIYVVDDQFYLPLKKLLEEFGLKEHVAKNGYKYIDKILATHLPGVEKTFLMKSSSTERQFILHSAAMAVLLLHQGKSVITEHVKNLRKQVLQDLFPSIVEVLNKQPLPKVNIETEPPAVSVDQNPPEEINTPRLDQGQSESAPIEPPVTPTSSSSTTQGSQQFITPASSMRKTLRQTFSPVSTTKLIEARDLRDEHKKENGRNRSRALDKRVKQQKAAFKKIAEEVHHGSKDDLIAGIAEAASCRHNGNTKEWDGSLSAEDILTIAKRVHNTKTKKSLYEILTRDHSAKISHCSAMEILQMQDHCSMNQLFRDLRRKLPGYFASERQTDKLKSKFNNEFEVILEPTETKTGFRINPKRLVRCLSFVYPWLSSTESEWWRLYGDARTFGGKKSVLISLSNINNESLLNGVAFQSPQDCWPIHIFYGGDTRLNLELNIGNNGKPGYLNNFIEEMYDSGKAVYVASDAMFADAILGGKLDPKSDNDFNLYN